MAPLTVVIAPQGSEVRRSGISRFPRSKRCRLPASEEGLSARPSSRPLIKQPTFEGYRPNHVTVCGGSAHARGRGQCVLANEDVRHSSSLLSNPYRSNKKNVHCPRLITNTHFPIPSPLYSYTIPKCKRRRCGGYVHLNN